MQAAVSEKQIYKDKLKALSLDSDLTVGVLLLHGLTGMPNEMRPVAKALEGLGCDVVAPMLPGHGQTHKEMLTCGWKDWLNGARESLNELSERCDIVVLGGLSMGSLLTIPLSIENPKVVGVISMSPTIRYDSKNSSNPFQIFLPFVDIIPFLGHMCYWTENPPYGLKDERLQRRITKEVQAARNGETGFGQFRTYAGSLRQLQHGVAHVKRVASQVKCPVLIMHSVEDTLTTIANPQTLLKWLGTSDKELVYLEGCDHVLPLDLKKEEVAYRCAEFVCRMVAARTK